MKSTTQKWTLRRPLSVAGILLLAGSLILQPLIAQDQRKALPAPAGPEFARDKNPALAEGKPMIQIALLLDTSSSMQGLIDQAKTHLWEIVNEMSDAKRDGKDPILQIALYEYGRNTLPAADCHVRKVVPMTTDFDEVYEKLIALNATTSPGSNEQCGRTIFQAVKELGWSGKADDLKAIFIAGNESFAQGALDYKAACKASISDGITVNTIYCGQQAEGIRDLWKEGALLADGIYLNIDHNKTVAAIVAPQDARIVALNSELNETYLARNNDAEKAKLRQTQLDEQAQAQSASTAVERTVAKSGKYYDAAAWDLVDAVKNDKLDLATLKDEELPETMREMSPEQRIAHIDQLAAKRAEISGKIKKLDEERKQFIAAERKKRAEGGKQDGGLDKAIIDGLKKEAARKKFDL